MTEPTAAALAELRAENAELRERVERAEHNWLFWKDTSDAHRVVIEDTEQERDAALARVEELEGALLAYVLAQSRILDRWSEADDAVRRGLWSALHVCEDAGRAALEGE